MLEGKVASEWEYNDARSDGFMRGGDDFTFAGIEIENTREWYDVKVRRALCNADGDEREIDM